MTEETPEVKQPETAENAEAKPETVEAAEVNNTAEPEVKAEPEAQAAEKKPLKPIRAVTKIDVRAITTLSFRNMLSGWIIYFGLMAALSGIGGIVWGVSQDMAIGLTMVLAGLLVPPAMFGVNVLIIRYTAAKSPEAKRNKVMSFVFGDQIAVSEKADGAEDRSHLYEWSVVQKVIETSKFFFLAVSQTTAIIVAKDGIADASTDDFKNLLKEKLQGKYKA